MWTFAIETCHEVDDMIWQIHDVLSVLGFVAQKFERQCRLIESTLSDNLDEGLFI